MHVIVKVNSCIISSIGIIPVTNFSYKSIKDIIENIFDKFLMYIVEKKNANVIIYAIIGWPVILDANSPNDIYAIVNNINPNNVVPKVDIFGVPKWLIIAKYIKENIP